jgi:hypothetical protein
MNIANLFFLLPCHRVPPALRRETILNWVETGLASNEGPCVFTRFPIAVRVGQDGVTQSRLARVLPLKPMPGMMWALSETG